MRQSHTAVIERNIDWSGSFTVEPYEAAWAGEAVYFVRVLESDNVSSPVEARVQISPDGIHWCDEGNVIRVGPQPGVYFCRVGHFGGWLRAAGEAPGAGRLRVIVYLVLKE